MTGVGRTVLSRRERQIMDILYRAGRATAAEVREALPDAPSYSGVRALLRVLEEKGHVTHAAEGARYVYRPTVPRTRAGSQALRKLVDTFFDGSPGLAAAALLDQTDALSGEEVERLQDLIRRARGEGR